MGRPLVFLTALAILTTCHGMQMPSSQQGPGLLSLIGLGQGAAQGPMTLGLNPAPPVPGAGGFSVGPVMAAAPLGGAMGPVNPIAQLLGGRGMLGASMMRNRMYFVQYQIYERKRKLMKRLIKLYENHGCVDPVQKFPNDNLAAAMAMIAGCDSPLANMSCTQYGATKVNFQTLMLQRSLGPMRRDMLASQMQAVSPYHMYKDYLLGQGRLNPAVFRLVNGPEGPGSGPAFGGEQLDNLKNMRRRYLPYQCQEIRASNLQMGLCCPGPRFNPSLGQLPGGSMEFPIPSQNNPMSGSPMAVPMPGMGGGGPMGGQVMPGMPGDTMGGGPMGGVPMGAGPMGGSPMGGSPMGGSPMGGVPMGGSPMNNFMSMGGPANPNPMQGFAMPGQMPNGMNAQFPSLPSMSQGNVLIPGMPGPMGSNFWQNMMNKMNSPVPKPKPKPKSPNPLVARMELKSKEKILHNVISYYKNQYGCVDAMKYTPQMMRFPMMSHFSRGCGPMADNVCRFVNLRKHRRALFMNRMYGNQKGMVTKLLNNMNPLTAISQRMQSGKNKMGNSAGGVGNPMSGMNNPMGGMGNPMSGMGNPMSGMGNPMGGMGNPMGGMGGPMGGMGNPMGGMGNPMSGMGNPMAGMGNPMAGMGNPMAGMGNPMAGMGNPMAGMGNPMAGMGNPMSGMGGRATGGAGGGLFGGGARAGLIGGMVMREMAGAEASEAREKLLPFQCEEIGINPMSKMGMCCPGPVGLTEQMQTMLSMNNA